MKKAILIAFLIALALMALAIHKKPTQTQIERIHAKTGNITTVRIYPGMTVTIERRR